MANAKSQAKSLDLKLAALRRDPDANVFILADARDADLAWGCVSPGERFPARHGTPAHYSMDEFREQCREIVRSGLVDILLASTSTHSLLAHREKLFQRSRVTPAIRANDTTDVWRGRGARHRDEPSRPFASSYIEEAQWGGHPKAWRQPSANARPVVNLGLYSMTFNNRVDCDRETLEAFKEFRLEAALKGFRYFLEVFPPNISYKESGLTPGEVPSFVNDKIARSLAGVSPEMRPDFLKLPYFGPRALEELRNYDSSVIVGILGGSSGTTHDAFKLLADAQRHGARCALFGRRIKESESPLLFLQTLRAIVDEGLPAKQAVHLYHDLLRRARLHPKRPLTKDLAVTFNDFTFTRL